MDIPQGALSLAAVGCLLLAAKWEEREEDVPLISTLTSVMNNEFSMKDLRTMEMIILDFKNWNSKLISKERRPPPLPIGRFFFNLSTRFNAKLKQMKISFRQ